MPYILKKYYPARNIIFFVGEGLLIFTAITGVNIFLGGLDEYAANFALYSARALIVTLVFQICLYYFDLYDLSVIPRFSDNAAQITIAFGFGCIVLSFLFYLFPTVIISTETFWISYLTICSSITIWRFIYVLTLKRKMFTRPIMLIGKGVLADKISTAIEEKKDSGYKIASRIIDIAKQQKISPSHIVVSQCNSALLQQALDNKIEKIILAFDERRGGTPFYDLILCKLMGGMKIVNGVEFYEELTGKVMVEKINPAWILFSEGFVVGRAMQIGKRLLDIIFSFFGLIVTLPVMLITALIIKMETPGPVFYSQERVGQKGKIIKLLKFRSMGVDAEKNGPVWASKTDSRVTKFGKIIRKLRIDEIPQMINVLKGEMSFVGPRPERPVFVSKLEENIPYYSVRHIVKPGITGWAQVLYPYGASEEDALRKLEYDLYYIKNLSFGMDLWIVFETIKTVLFQRGAR